MGHQTEKPLYCDCKHKPLLATYGIDSRGQLFVHLKVFKGDRVYGEIVVTHGVAKIRCRNCMVWHRVRIRRNVAHLTPTREPETLPRDVSVRVLD